ncbi:anthranilate phosphoribosyltransferase [Nocardioides marmoriginsengisoli]|uniref:Anthranilate phosphoribosyltransferase n=1 Tax=Nocardioides marmoriginsengisoli TaxID=661483 RepID=A0A3N0CLC9_9ACTN|nr:anthranilate phosphoribosyltransferase [Nocardioides marmoriginsengisoli]RNL64250.1 anthranilate phosphoribosyltransferase [Nocardioides marmoriginsengisoli]
MSGHTWPEVLTALVAGTDLSADQTSWAMGEILAGAATPVQIAGFAVALRSKGETVDEMQGLVDAMYQHAAPLAVEGRTLDIVGTGGDRSFSVNISTMAAIVAAGAGVTVVKHGNRSASSKAGSADVLELLGIHLDLPADRVAAVAAEAGITFAFAAAFHPALRHAAVARSELGIGTTFNFLGPIANPAKPAAQAIGCADPRMAPVMAGVFARRGVDAWVFRGDDGLDELTTTTTSRIWTVRAGEVVEESLDPAALGIPAGTAEGLRGQDAAYNADVVRRLLAGEVGPVRDAVVLNAGAALAVHADEAGSLVDRVAAGMERAAAALDSGAAQATLDRWVAAAAH